MPIARSAILSGLAALLLGSVTAGAQELSEIRIDWATYNPVSVLLKEEGLLEEEFANDGIAITWVQSAGSNKALEFLNASSIDFGSTAGSAAFLARVNGNPVHSIYVYSKPEWTALVTGADTDIQEVADLEGRTVAVTRGTDPHIFLVRALANAGLSERDLNLVLLQHTDGRTALQRGDVDAWAGLDPLMAAAEIEDGARLFFRDRDANTWGVLNTREDFAEEHPEIVERVLSVYEEARQRALAEPETLKALLVEATGLPDEVIARQLERTDLSHSRIGNEQAATILAAGEALRDAGVIGADVDVAATVDELIDARFGGVGQ